MDEPRETQAKVFTPCPGCGNRVPDDDAIWVYQQKFYCSEECVRRRNSRV